MFPACAAHKIFKNRQNEQKKMGLTQSLIKQMKEKNPFSNQFKQQKRGKDTLENGII